MQSNHNLRSAWGRSLFLVPCLWACAGEAPTDQEPTDTGEDTGMMTGSGGGIDPSGSGGNDDDVHDDSAGGSASGGGGVCTDEITFGIYVDVIGGGQAPAPPPAGEKVARVLGAPCYATVTIQDGTYEEELRCWSGGLDCRCGGAENRPGEYTVEVIWGSGSETQVVTVGSDGCHLISEELTFEVPFD